MKIKTLVCLAIAGISLAWGASTFSQTPTPAPAPVADPAVPAVSLPPGTTDAVAGILSTLAQKYTWLITVITIVGALRLVVVPIRDAIHAVILATPTTKDDEIEAKVENSKAWTWFLYVLNWFGSIKPPPGK